MKGRMEELTGVVVAILLMTGIFTAVIYYLIPMPVTDSVISGFVITIVTVMAHELMHREYAVEVCNRRAEFTLTKFAVVATLVSIFVMCILIVIKQYTGWYTYLIPIVASPGGVYVAMRKADKCYDNIAIVAPFYNFVVGLITLWYLYTVTNPPFILNDVNNFTLSLIALISYFSFALAFINALPIKIGDVALDGYWAFTVDRNDFVTKAIALVIITVSFIILFVARIWVIILQ